MVGWFTPVEFWYFSNDTVLVYFELSAKYASSAVTRLRRSDFMAVMYAFDLVFANFGIAIAARMPMITTTINNSISVKPLRLRSISNSWVLRDVFYGRPVPGFCWTTHWLARSKAREGPLKGSL